MSETTNNIFSSRLLKGVIMLGLMIGIGFIPAPEPLTPYGMKVLGVFVGTLFGWIFIEIGSTSIIALVVLALVGGADFTSILGGTFGSQISVMMFAMLFLSVYIEHKGLGQFIVNWLMRRKIILGRPYLFFFFFLLGSYLIALVSSSFVSLFVMLSLFRDINNVAGFKINSKENCIFLIGIILSSLFGELSLPVKGAIVVYFGIYTGYTGVAINTLRFMLALIPTSLFLMVLYTAFCKFILRADLNGLIEGSKILTKEPMEKITKEQKLAVVVLIAFIVVMLIPSIPLNFAFWKLLQSFGLGGLSLLVMGFFYFIHVDGKPVFDLKALSKDFGWDLWFMVSSVQYLAGMLTTEATGIQPFLSETLYPIISGLNSTLLIFALILFTAVLTNFANNIVIGSLMVSFAALIGGNIGDLNMAAVVLVVALSAMICVGTPAGSPNTAVVYGQKEFVDYKSMFKYGIITVGFMVICISFLVWPYINFIM